jgi:hypothetical protein
MGRGREVTIHAKKKEDKWWDKLQSGAKLSNVKVDWNSWKDEDEREATSALSFHCTVVHSIFTLSRLAALRRPSHSTVAS